MKKLNIQLDIRAEDLKKKLNIKNGVDYVLTESDKEEIATKITVPVVEKIIEKTIEKTEVIKEAEIVGELIVEKINELPTDDESLKIDASHIKNLPKSGGNVFGGKHNLYQLNDVSIQTPTNNQVLKYNSTTQLWENGTGGSSTVTTNASLTGDGSAGTPLGINLANANTWFAQQDNTSIFRNNSNIDYYSGGGGANDVIVAAAGQNGVSGWVGLKFSASTLDLNAQTEDGSLVPFRAQSVTASSYGGTWNGDTISQLYGGTGATGYGANRVIYQDGGNTAFTSTAGFTFSGTNLLISNTLITAQNRIHINESGATAIYTQYTNSATGSTSSDGFQVGITSAGVAELRQRENLDLDIYVNNTRRASFPSSQAFGFWLPCSTAGTYWSFRTSGITSGFGYSLRFNDAADTLGYGATYRHALQYSAGESFCIVGNGTTPHFVVEDGGDIGIGTGTGSVPAKLTVIKTIEQFRLGYDTSNYVTHTISSGGLLSWQTTAGATAGVYTLTPHGAGGDGTNRTLSFGTAWGNAALWLYTNGATTRFGWGMRADSMQFFAPTTTGGTYTWNIGGDLQATGTNEIMRLYQYASGTGAGLGLGRGVFGGTTPYRIDLEGVSLAGGSAGVENIIRFSRGQTGGVSYPEAFAMAIGRFSSSGLQPDTRIDFILKNSSVTDIIPDVTVMSLNSNGRVLIGAGGAASATLHLASSTSGSGSNAFQIYNAGSALRMSYRDDGRLWIGTGTASYNGFLTLDAGSGTQTEIQFTTNASGRTSSDGFYLQYTDAVGARYLMMESQPHVFYISGSEVARFSNTGAVMQITGTLAAQYSGAGSTRGGTISLISSAGTPQDWYMAVAGTDNVTVNGRSWFLYDNTNSVARFFVNTSGDVGVGLGSTAASARLHLVKTTEQFRSGYDAATNYWSATTSSAGATTFDAAGASASFIFSDAVTINGSLTLSAQNIITDTTTGMKIGTATTQKIGFFNATPIVQQTTTSQTPSTFVANTSGIVDDTATWDGYTIGDIVKILRAFGLIA